MDIKEIRLSNLQSILLTRLQPSFRRVMGRYNSSREDFLQLVGSKFPKVNIEFTKS